MATYEVDIGGATYEVDAPDERTAWRWANATHSKAAKPAANRYDPTEGMSTGDKVLAGVGKAFADLGRGAGQMARGGLEAVGAKGAADSMGLPTEADIAESRRLDAPLMNTGAGMAGNIGGSLIPAVATAAIPGANTYTGAAAGGALMGLLNPTVEGESRLANAGLGAATGAAGQGVANLVGRAVAPVRSSLSPEMQRLARAAQAEGIPLDAAQLTGSKPLQTINAVMENLPLTAGREAAKRSAQGDAFTAAALRRAGIGGNSAAPEVLRAQKAALGQQFEDIAGRNAIDMSKGTILHDFADIYQESARRLSDAGPIQRTIDDIFYAAESGVLPGTLYQGWRSKLGRMARGNDAEAHFAAQAKKALDRAFNSQISGADAQAWGQASREYGNLKTLLDAMGGAGVAPNTGALSPAQLARALNNAVGREGKALGRGDLNDLVRVGQTFVKDQVPNSGTAQRLLYQSLLTGGLGLGGGIAAGADPAAALGYGAAGLAGPRLAQALLNSGAGQRYLTQGVTNEYAQALAELLKRGAPALGIAAPALLDTQ